MDKDNYLQLELFHHKDKPENKQLSGLFLSYIKNFEKIVLLIIIFLITGIIAFCVGVEKGKHIVLSRLNNRIDLAHANRVQEDKTVIAQKQNFKSPGAEIGGAKIASSQIPVTKPVSVSVIPTPNQLIINELSGKYTIQIASFKTKVNAQKYIDELKSQGLLPVLLTKGNFSILCVGNFKDQETAKSLLTELKKKYRDCYIRRL